MTHLQWLGRAAALMLLAAAVVASSRCERHDPQGSEVAPATIRILTGPRGLTFGPLGDALAAAYGRALPDLRFEAVPTAGTGANLQSLQTGEAELAFSVAN